jgi:hypothetical protein
LGSLYGRTSNGLGQNGIQLRDAGIFHWSGK